MPHRLITLIAAIERLEQRLSKGQTPGDSVLSNQELLEALHGIHQQYAAACTQGSWETQHLQLSDAVQRFLNARGNTHRLSLRHAFLLQLTETLFHFIEYSCDLNPCVYAALQGLQIGFARILTKDAAILIHPNQACWQFLDLLAVAFKGYDQYSGQRAHALLREAERKVADAIASSLSEGEACQDAKRAFAGLLQRYNRESLLYEKSLISKEQGQAVLDDARLIVKRYLLAAVRGHRLPAQLLRFLQEIWGNYLYVTYLREGLESDAWKRGIEVIPLLVRSLSIHDSHEMLRFYQEELAQALAVVRDGAESLHQDVLFTQSVLEYLESVPMQVIRGEELEPSVLEEVLVETDLDDPDVELSPADLQALQGLHVGGWYLIQAGDVASRGKLIQKDAALGYCLFANYSGFKAARLEVAGLAEALADGKLQHLAPIPVAAQALEAALTHLEAQLQHLETKVRQAEQEREHRRAEKKTRQVGQVREPAQTKEGTPREGLQEQTRHEEVETREQRLSTAKEPARPAVQEQDLVQQRGQEQELQSALVKVRRLQPGGRLEFLTTDNVKRTCQLGLKIRSSQKMIFIDQLGQKVAEMLPADLAARLVEGQARIIDYGVAFDDALQSLILDRSGKIRVE